MKVKDIIPIIDENILIRIRASGETTMPREGLLEYYGDIEVGKITSGTDRSWEEWSHEQTNANGYKCKNGGAGYRTYQTITLWDKEYLKE